MMHAAALGCLYYNHTPHYTTLDWPDIELTAVSLTQSVRARTYMLAGLAGLAGLGWPGLRR